MIDGAHRRLLARDSPELRCSCARKTLRKRFRRGHARVFGYNATDKSRECFVS